MTKLRLLAPTITAIVIIILSLGWFRSCDRVKELKDEAYQAQNGARKVEEVQNAGQAVRDSLIAEINATRKKTRMADSVKIIALESRNRRLTRELASARVKIQPVVDSLPEIAHYVALTDSLLSVKDSLILVEQMRNMINTKSYQAEIVLLHQNIESQKAIGDAWRTSAEQSERKAAKQEKRKRFWRFTSIVLAGAAGVLIVNGQ